MSQLVAAIVGSITFFSGALPHTRLSPPRRASALQIVGGVVSGQLAAQVPPRDNPQVRTGTAVLRGRVVADDTGQPLRKAQVRIFGSPGPGVQPENRLATTDASGRYEFKDLPAGRYTLSAAKGSYVSLQYGQQRPLATGKPVEVNDGQTIERIDFSLPRGALIAGRVLDEFGEPVADVQVLPLRYLVGGPGRRLQPTGRSATTNDIGEFRLYGLPPGDYYVAAILRNFAAFGDSDDRSGYAPTYYPGTADVAAASKLNLGLAQSITDISIPLLPVRTARVSGTAVDSRGRPMRGIVMAQQPRTGLPGFGVTGPGQIRPDGSFTINGLPPGDYMLQIQPSSVDGVNSPESASAEITVAGNDVTGVRLVGVGPSTITGRLIVEPALVQTLERSKLRVAASPAPIGGVFFQSGPTPGPSPINDDLTFQTKARPGPVRINVIGMPPGWSIKALRYRGADVTDSSLDVRPNEDVVDVEVQLTNQTTTVSGVVTNNRGEAVKDYLVILFARDRNKWEPPSRYVRMSRADQDGRFKVTGLPPGDYLTSALNDVDPGQASDPDFLERLQNRTSRFSLGEGETKTLDLKLNSAP